MPDPITIQIDTTKANSLLGSLYDAMVAQDGSGDARAIVLDEVIHMSRAISNQTPPWKPGGKGADMEKIGVKSITRELDNLIGEATSDLITEVSQKWGLKDVVGWETNRQGNRVELLWSNVLPEAQNLNKLHESYRRKDGGSDISGKVPLTRGTKGTWGKRIIVQQGAKQPYIDKKLALVGRWKASWAYVAYKLGATSNIKNYVKRHMFTLGNLTIANLDGLKDPIKPFVIFGSRIPGNYRLSFRNRINNYVIKPRMKAIQTKLGRMLKGYKVNIAAGQKALACYDKTQVEPQEIIT